MHLILNSSKRMTGKHFLRKPAIFRKHLLRKPAAILCILCLCISLFTGCKGDDAELLSNYAAKDSVANFDVGAQVEAIAAPLMSEWFLCDITEDMMDPDYVFDADDPSRSGCAFVINRTDNKLVFGYGMLDKVYPASITKLMTTLIVLRECSMTETITISEEISKLSRGSNAVFEEGDKITIYNMLECLLTVSANNAAIALAQYISGSEEAFIEKMTSEMHKLGVNSTSFKNASGLHNAEHYTNAYDMYVVFQECLKYEPFREIMKITKGEYEYYNKDGETKIRQIETTNAFKLGKYPYPSEELTILGGKTGTTPQAGYCLMLYVKNKQGTEYILGVYHAATEEKLYHQLNDLMSTYCKN